jgi:SAM-dependent methyltransferase
MAVNSLALTETAHAFDGVASDYARQNEENPLLCAMRARVLATLRAHVPPGAHVLDLGCGPGTDVETLARSGYWVTAVDASGAMIREATSRLADAGLAGRADLRHLGIDEIDALAPVQFDAAYSNFGPLNCVPCLGTAAARIAERLRPGGVFVASVIGRVCPWEIALHIVRRNWARARVRFRRGPVPVPLSGRTVWTSYYTPDEFERAFADAGLRCVHLSALGLFAPPPYLDAFAARHRALVRALQRLDDALGGRAPFRSWGDHFLIVMVKP